MTGQRKPSAASQSQKSLDDRIRIRRERNAARAAALQAAAQQRKAPTRRPTASVDLSAQLMEKIRRQADRKYDELFSQPGVSLEKDGRLKLADGSFTSRMAIQRELRNQALREKREAKRAKLAAPSYQPKSTEPKPAAPMRRRAEKPAVTEAGKHPDSRKAKRLERERRTVAVDRRDISELLEQADAFEAQGDFRRAAIMLLQTGDDRIKYLERIGENFMREGLYRDVIGNLAPYCGYKGVSAAIPAMVGACRLKLGQYDKANRTVGPILSDPAYGGMAREISATAFLEQAQPWMVLELLNKPANKTQETLHTAAQMALALASDEPAQLAHLLVRIKPEQLVREAGFWHLQHDLPEEQLALPKIKLAPASFAKAITLADAMLQNNRPDLAVTQIFNSTKVPKPETSREVQLYVQAHILKAQAHFEFSQLLPMHKLDIRQPQIDQAFQACAVALMKRPTDKDLLVLAAEIVGHSSKDEHKARLAAVLDAARSVPAEVKADAHDCEPVAENLTRAFEKQALAKVERRPHRPSPGARRTGGFNCVR